MREEKSTPNFPELEHHARLVRLTMLMRLTMLARLWAPENARFPILHLHPSPGYLRGLLSCPRLAHASMPFPLNTSAPQHLNTSTPCLVQRQSRSPDEEAVAECLIRRSSLGDLSWPWRVPLDLERPLGRQATRPPVIISSSPGQHEHEACPIQLLAPGTHYPMLD